MVNTVKSVNSVMSKSSQVALSLRAIDLRIFIRVFSCSSSALRKAVQSQLPGSASKACLDKCYTGFFFIE